MLMLYNVCIVILYILTTGCWILRLDQEGVSLDCIPEMVYVLVGLLIVL